MSITRTSAWQAILAQARNHTIAELLESEPARAQRLTLKAAGLTLDATRTGLSLANLDALHAFARQQDVTGALNRMMQGAIVNTTENRAALHSALRLPNPAPEVAAMLDRMRDLAAGVKARGIAHIIGIGIGGSDLGPRFVCRALWDGQGPKPLFAGNADGDDLDEKLKQCNPATTLVIVASKTFTTQETMLNLQAARAWLGDNARLLAVTANPEAAAREGVDAASILPLWDWVGGRFSVWSSVGLSIALSCGFDVFTRFLAGANAADRHAAEAPVESNMPLLLALLTVWHRNVCGYPVQAMLPYSHRLSLMPAWGQQLDMESNGKNVDRDGNPCDYHTAPVTFGAAGTIVQHSFMQLVQQGSMVIPCDFIGVSHGQPNGDVMLANMHAQIDALTFGGGDEPFGHLPGNRPATAILLDALTPETLGALMATWEHKTACLGALWNINSFDQFGVERGKVLAKQHLARR